LAFVAALQHLPASQRAVLILREVLGFSARETADALGSTVASVNSALQRARRAVDERTPEQSQQRTLRAIGDERLEEIVGRYVEAWERDDVSAVVALLTEDAAIAMPPLRTWFGGTREEFARFLELWPLSGKWHWKTLRTRANGQPAIAFYAYNEALGYNEPFALNVLRFRGEQVAEVVAFVARATDLPPQASYEHWPDRPPDPDWMQVAFGQFGLPDRL
jgi:RNA polymerase sigma-70 factor, ECF subfamily